MGLAVAMVAPCPCGDKLHCLHHHIYHTCEKPGAKVHAIHYAIAVSQTDMLPS